MNFQLKINKRWILPGSLYFVLCTFITSCSGEKNKTIEIFSEDSTNPSVAKSDGLSGGAKIFSDNCKVCHGMDGKKQLAGAKDLSISTLNLDQRIQQITMGKVSGKTVMPGYTGLLTETQIREVALYLDELKK